LVDLSEIVNAASAAFRTVDTTDEADRIAALAFSRCEEAKADNAPPPTQSDIRSLMLRVEAWQRKPKSCAWRRSIDSLKQQKCDR